MRMYPNRFQKTSLGDGAAIGLSSGLGAGALAAGAGTTYALNRVNKKIEGLAEAVGSSLREAFDPGVGVRRTLEALDSGLEAVGELEEKGPFKIFRRYPALYRKSVRYAPLALGGLAAAGGLTYALLNNRGHDMDQGLSE